MAWVRRLLRVPPLILLAGTAQCGSTSDAPPGQVLLFIDTDAPVASMAGERAFLTDASVDTLRVDILAPDNTIVRSVDFAAPDEANWPVSFGLRGMDGAVVARLRLRAFRAQRSAIATDPTTGAKVFEPIAGYTIDRVVELPIPNDKGVFAFRTVLRSQCRGHRPDFTQRTTCVASGLEDGSFRDGIESVPPDPAPPREPMWWPSNPDYHDGVPVDCDGAVCPAGSVCVPGGFFMLGNLRVVGFGAPRRHDAAPAHPVAMQRFCIDQSETTVGRFVSLGAPWPADLTGVYDPYGNQLCTWIDHALAAPEPRYAPTKPMNCITHDEAQLACQLAGGRLPTEAEWEYVATGIGRGTLFPWGESPPTCDTAILEQQETEFVFVPECGVDGVEDVHDRSTAKADAVTLWRKSDDTQLADVWHLGGSMSEWTFDSFSAYDDTTSVTNCWQYEGVFRHPSCSLIGDNYSVRGGNYQDVLEVAYSALRQNEANDPGDYIGFRCVYPVEGDTDPVSVIDPSAGEPPGDPGEPPGGPPDPNEERP